MAGFTVTNANRFLETGTLDQKTLKVDNGEMQTPLDGVQGQSFADTLNQAIQNTNELQKISNKKIEDLATGKTDNVADVMIASEKADIALRLMVQVRNKIVDAYQEIMKMQV